MNNFTAKYRSTFLLILFFLLSRIAHAQYPTFFSYNDENGLPSNEVYSIIQDKKGFIWFGCDAGLYKFDGVKYISYKSVSQKSKAITGLCISSTGKLFCFNFQGQIFYIENDSLNELKHLLQHIPNIACDTKANLYINHLNGVSAFNEKTKKWKTYNNFETKDSSFNNLFTKSVKVNRQNTVHFLANFGIGTIANNKLQLHKNNYFTKNPPGNFIMECVNNEAWIFSVSENLVYNYNNDNTKEIKNKKLINNLLGRKITNVKYLSDGNLWICTYKGVVQYNPETDSVRLFYPNFSFSDCIIDREGNYWFTTLQNGIIRLPNLNFEIWNNNNKTIGNDKLTKVTTHNSNIYFATVSGEIGSLNVNTNHLKLIQSLGGKDIQCFEHNKLDDCIYFGINNNIYELKNNQIKLKHDEIAPAKSILKISDKYILASSFGTYLFMEGKENEKYKITSSWTREIAFDSIQNQVWLATNDGLMKYFYNKKNWVCADTLFLNTQILSITFNKVSKLLYILSFKGEIYSVNSNGKSQLISLLPTNVQPYKLKFQSEKLFIATNKGLWIYNILSKKWQILNKLSGLASDNVQDFCILSQNIWLATGKGLQKIPISIENDKSVPLVYLKKVKIGSAIIKDLSYLKLKYNESLILFPEASSYRSNGDFYYAYQFKKLDTTWNFLPSNTEQLAIPSIPSGEFEIEIKIVDHLGHDSKNIIHIKGYVSPPFWKTIWFLGSSILLLLCIAYFLFNQRIKKLRKEQSKEIERLNLENELRLTQQTALKAQMNPHFIFNVLNSIKGYIYKNDKQKASSYLNDFADLIRNVLDMSNINSASLEDELKLIKLYIELEAMMLSSDFSYSITIDESIDQRALKIPSLIIQPYIENVFKHGLKNKTGKKELSLNCYLNNDFNLIIEITDNGIGRAASQKIQEQQSKNYTSFATNAIEKRISLVNREGKQHISSLTVDLKSEDGKAEGTKVKLEITFK